MTDPTPATNQPTMPTLDDDDSSTIQMLLHFSEIALGIADIATNVRGRLLNGGWECQPSDIAAFNVFMMLCSQTLAPTRPHIENPFAFFAQIAPASPPPEDDGEAEDE